MTKRQRWHYQGRGEVDGVDCYIWHAYVDMVMDVRKVACALPVATFWPPRWPTAANPLVWR